MAVTDTGTDPKEVQTGDGTDDPEGVGDEEVVDGTGDGSLDDDPDAGKAGEDTGAGEEEDDDPPLSLPYGLDGKETKFEYRIVVREDGKSELDEDTKSRLAQVLPLRTFQSKFDRSQKDLKGAEGRVEAAEKALRASEERHVQLKNKVDPFTHHLAVLNDPAAREHFEKVAFAKQLKVAGFDPSIGFDPHSAREEQITHRENRVRWETETRPFVSEMQREALKTVHPDISDEEVDKVMSFVGSNSASLQPQLTPDPVLGYPRFAFKDDADMNAKMRRLAEVPLMARKLMIADGLIESAQLKDLKEENKNLTDKFDRATRKAKMKNTGGSGAGSKGGKKKDAPKPIADPEDFTDQWIKDHPDMMKD